MGKKIIISFISIVFLTAALPVQADKLTPAENANVRTAAQFIESAGMGSMADNIITVLDNGEIESDPGQPNKAITSGIGGTITVRSDIIGGDKKKRNTRFKDLPPALQYDRVAELAGVLIHEKTHYHQNWYVRSVTGLGTWVAGEIEAYANEDSAYETFRQSIPPNDPDKDKKEKAIERLIDDKHAAEDEVLSLRKDSWNDSGGSALAALAPYGKANVNITWKDGGTFHGWHMKNGKVLQWSREPFQNPDITITVSEEILDGMLFGHTSLDEAQRAVDLGYFVIEEGGNLPPATDETTADGQIEGEGTEIQANNVNMFTLIVGIIVVAVIIGTGILLYRRYNASKASE